MFWKSWKHEYLTSLRERTQTCLKTGRVHSEFLPKINDVVIVKAIQQEETGNLAKSLNYRKVETVTPDQ